jgi:4-aminobutyrate aminotransferase-like enzyme
VIRILVPLVISDSDLARGLELLEESLVDAGAGPG